VTRNTSRFDVHGVKSGSTSRLELTPTVGIVGVRLLQSRKSGMHRCAVRASGSRASVSMSKSEPSNNWRFVILFHSHPTEADHFDLMLERNGVLMTWRVDSEPELAARAPGVKCQQLSNHRIAYLDYEGPISGNRGSVRRHDSGTYFAKTLDAPLIHVHFRGSRLRGDFILQQDEARPDQWRLRMA
jgi:DNA polymerase Ligase (LigD)